MAVSTFAARFKLIEMVGLASGNVEGLWGDNQDASPHRDHTTYKFPKL